MPIFFLFCFGSNNFATDRNAATERQNTRRGTMLRHLILYDRKTSEFHDDESVLPGPPRGRGGQRRQFATGPQGLRVASLDVFKEPTNGSSLHGSKSPSRFRFPRFPCFLPLLLASIPDKSRLILQFCPYASKNFRRPATNYYP